jgi:hypothetical protein
LEGEYAGFFCSGVLALYEKKVIVLDLVSQVRDVVLMNVYLDLGDPGGSGFWNEGYMGKGGKWEDQFTSNLGTRWTDPITSRRVPIK